jgi:molybdate transport system permease protein
MLSDSSLSAISLTLQLAFTTVAILLLIGTPISWWLARSQWRFKPAIEALIALPLVLPPTVIGFYLLLTLGPNGPLSGLMDFFGIRTLNFTFTGLVIGSVFYSMPFVIQPLQQAFQTVKKRHLEAAATLGAKPLDRFFSIILPIAKPGYLTAAVLGFAHTLGEFGVVLMIGGNIPGKTQVLSIAIYEQVETLEYTQAHWLSGGLLVLSFVMLILVYSVNRRSGVLKS